MVFGIMIGPRPARRVNMVTAWPTIASLACLAASAAPAVAAADVSTVLRQMTQEFSDAGQRGDARTMERLLDDRVVFVNEGGDVATKTDMLAGAAPPAAGVHVKLFVTYWNCEVHGDVAVTSFIDDQLVDSGGELMHAKYRSVETWLKSAGVWRMIGSETIALQDDPASVALSPAQLDQYVGAYLSKAGMRFVFTREGERLFAAVNGGQAVVQNAEVRDIVFTPGRYRMRKVFLRDSTGRVTGFAYRREGHDTVFTRVANHGGS